ncbi:MAG TPA: hypothetical protein VF133_03815 [Terriglobales bacterium]
MRHARTAVLTLGLFSAALVFAQAPAGAPNSPVSYSSVTELNQLISNLQQASMGAQDDISHLRIEKWKTDSGTKRQTQADSESIRRNLQDALPSMLAELKNAPENLALTFKVYRNLDALYDVMTSLTESAGAFGGKEEYQALSKDLGAIEGSRRAFAERMDKLANTKENEISQLRVELQSARAAAAPPKKTVVDDTAPEPKKTVHKKSATKPKPKPSSNQTKPNTPAPQSQPQQ